MSHLGAVIVAPIPVRYGFVPAAALSAILLHSSVVVRSAPRYLPFTPEARPTFVPMDFVRTATAALSMLTIFPAAVPQAPQNSVPSPPAQICTLRIHVDGLRNSNGVVGSIIFKSPDGWPEDKNKSFRHGPTPIAPNQRQATVSWDNLPPGIYGVAVIHDENRNAKLDRNLIGIPKEGFGFANNPHVGLSAPPFQAAIVHVQCPATETSIHLQYK